MLTDEEIGLGGYRFEDLQDLRIVTNRTDLARKQTELGFPLPVKTGNSQAMFLRAEVRAWLRQRIALRDVQIQNSTAAENDAPIHRSGKVAAHGTREREPKQGRAEGARSNTE